MIGKDLSPIDKSLINFDHSKLHNMDMIYNSENERLIWRGDTQDYILVSQWVSDYLHNPNSEWEIL